MNRSKVTGIVGTLSLIGFIALIIMVTFWTPNWMKEGTVDEQGTGVTVTNVTTRSNNGEFSIIDITYEGETHQYLNNSYKLAHWEGCKYCKHKIEE